MDALGVRGVFGDIAPANTVGTELTLLKLALADWTHDTLSPKWDIASALAEHAVGIVLLEARAAQNFGVVFHASDCMNGISESSRNCLFGDVEGGKLTLVDVDGNVVDERAILVILHPLSITHIRPVVTLHFVTRGVVLPLIDWGTAITLEMIV